MNVANLQRAYTLGEHLSQVNLTIKQINTILDTKKVDSDGPEGPNANGLYSFHMGEFRNDRDLDIDLSGLKVGIKILTHTRTLLEKLRLDILAEIETL